MSGGRGQARGAHVAAAVEGDARARARVRVARRARERRTVVSHGADGRRTFGSLKHTDRCCSSSTVRLGPWNLWRIQRISAPKTTSKC